MDGIEALVSFADPIQQSKPMKTISISILFLVTVPFHLVAQDGSTPIAKPNVQPSYFTYSPLLVEDTKANHIIHPGNQSKRQNDSQLNLSSFGGGNSFKPAAVRVASKPTEPLELNSSAVRRMTKFQLAREAANEVLTAPKVSAAEFGMAQDIVKPTPVNSNPVIPQPPQEVPQPSSSDLRPRDFQQEAPTRIEEPPSMQRASAVDQQRFSVPPGPVSLDDLQMSQRANSWEAKPNTMRDIVDHFSPGGEPFAQRGIVGQPNFFGVDRRSCCDEWSGVCKCGGLKSNPGHLGIPWLRSKDNCDSATKLIGKHRDKHQARRAANGCGCPSCCK